jgi:nitrate/nitrite-specific signal transduction histidine kinase
MKEGTIMSERPTTRAHTAKHAKAKIVHMRIRQMDKDIEITVADDGRGFDPAIFELVAIN